MNQPFWKILATLEDGTQQDISDRISSFKHSRSCDKENEVSFVVEFGYVDEIDDVVFLGQRITFSYGFRGKVQSKSRLARVVDIKYNYNNKVSMSIKCRDQSTLIKKTSANIVWDDVTTSDIAKTVAERYGLTFEGEETEKKWNSYPQSQKSDWAFLQEIVNKEEGGNYIVYVSDGVLFLERIALDKPSIFAFNYRDGNSKWISFSTSRQEKQPSTGSAAKTKVVGFDPDEKQLVSEDVAPDTQADEIADGDYRFNYSGNGEPLETVKDLVENVTGSEVSDNSGFFSVDGGDQKTFEKKVEVGDTIVTNLSDKDEIRNKANSRKKKATFKATTGTLKIFGTPNLEPNRVITINGVLKRHEGNWLIKQVDESISSSGYTTTLKLEKNASKRPNKPSELTGSTKIEDPTKINTSVGDDTADPQPKKEVLLFDENGNPITAPKTPYKAPSKDGSIVDLVNTAIQVIQQ